MFQRDYLLQQLQRFSETLARALRGAIILKSEASIQEAEAAIGEVLDLDAGMVMALTPESLVTMMRLSGVGDATASHVAYAFGRLADAYTIQGDPATAQLRRLQARGVAQAFNCDLEAYPQEFAQLEAQIAEAQNAERS
jgi:hypothetical protein